MTHPFSPSAGVTRSRMRAGRQAGGSQAPSLPATGDSCTGRGHLQRSCSVFKIHQNASLLPVYAKTIVENLSFLKTSVYVNPPINRHLFRCCSSCVLAEADTPTPGGHVPLSCTLNRIQEIRNQ